MYDFNLNITKKGTYSGIIGLTTSGGLKATYYKTVDFYSAHEVLDIYNHAGILPQKYTQIDKSIDIDVGYNSVLPTVTTFPTEFFSIKWEGYLLAATTEKYRLTLLTSEMYMIKMKIGEEWVIDTTKNLNKLWADIDLEKGKLYMMEVKYVEKKGKTLFKLFWESDSMMKKIIPESNLFNTLYSSTTPFILTVNPRDTDPQTSTMTGDYSQAVVGVEEVHIITLKDVLDNVQIHTNDVVTGKVMDGTTLLSTVTANQTEIKYTINKSGTFKIEVFVQVNGAGTALPIKDSPFTVVCAESTTDYTKTTITGAGATNAIAGHLTSFIVTQFDAQSNQKKTGGDTVTV